jgi:hypothetical protein
VVLNKVSIISISPEILRIIYPDCSINIMFLHSILWITKPEQNIMWNGKYTL